MPNVKLYYRAAHLATLIHWWVPSGKVNWAGEQVGIPIPLSERMLLNSTGVYIRAKLTIFTSVNENMFIV